MTDALFVARGVSWRVLHTFFTNKAFLLPSLSFDPAAAEELRSVQLTSSLELSRFVKPLSPPPRLVVAVL